MPDDAPIRPSFREAVRFWFRLGCISFGGPAGQIALMHTELVDRKRWISEARFLHALNYCMLLPGPEAQQLATYCGWALHGTRGALAAGGLFVLPSAVLLLALSFLYVLHGDVPWVASVFFGLKAAVIAIVAGAMVRLGRKALRHPAAWIVAGAALLALAWWALPYPAVIALAALAGWLTGRMKPGIWKTAGHGSAPDDVVAPATAFRWAAEFRRVARVGAAGLALWFAPTVAACVWLGPGHVLAAMGLFFSKAALVTFGGAYAVLPYVAQQAVEHHGWLSTAQMIDGLALAETTPGPLIMVLQFVGFVGGWQHPGGLSPWMCAVIAAALTTWTTFVPSFLWIFLGAPWVDRMRGNAVLESALGAVTAAVVGVIAKLALWFAWHAVVPVPGGFDPAMAVLALGAILALVVAKRPVHEVLVGCAAAGLLAGVFGWT